MADGMDALGVAIAEGRLGFAGALDELMSAHIRLFGMPNTVGALNRLETRITERLIEVTEAAIEREGKGVDPVERQGWLQRVGAFIRLEKDTGR